MTTMNKIKAILAAAALSPILFLENCNCGTESIDTSTLKNGISRKEKTFMKPDAPQQTHSIQELNSKWVWETTEGDAATNFEVKIEQQSDTEIRIINFMNIDGESITATVEDDLIKFSGELAGGNLLIQNGKGTITNGWINIQLSYNTFDGDTSEQFKVMLSKGEAL